MTLPLFLLIFMLLSGNGFAFEDCDKAFEKDGSKWLSKGMNDTYSQCRIANALEQIVEKMK